MPSLLHDVRYSNPCTVPEGSRSLRLPISRQSTHEGGIVSHPHRPPLPPRKYSWYALQSEAESTSGPQCAWRKDSNDTTRNPACSAVSQLTASPRAPVGTDVCTAQRYTETLWPMGCRWANMKLWTSRKYTIH